MDTRRESSKTTSYDVFLSFRGEDTRKNFTGHLYSRLCQVGINTFIDDEELRKGDVISTKLCKAIEESRVSIIVFSKNYASSSWCLDELVKILECKDKLKQTVLPVFYDVEPCQVRNHQSGCFGEALGKLKERSFGAERMEKWTASLTEAANLSGWDLRNVADGHESKFIGSIIKQVLQEVNQTPLDVAHYPIGLESRIEHIELLLQSGSEHEVRMLGIYGVGGIGKTTLAKAIYNRIFRDFSSSCFLSNVRLEVEEFGLVKLQEKLLNQILKTKDVKVSSVAEGVNLIKARLGSKKVLIVLDDVDRINQLESLARERSWFGLGSLIIVTTRDEHLLCRLETTERYKAELLNDNEGQQLFYRHAFDSLSPPLEYVGVAQDITRYSGGLPLALVVLGSHLQGRSIEEWRNEFHKLRAIPHGDIQKILKISFDGLDCETQSVFLDIACAFYGLRLSLDEVATTLNACGFYAKSAIATLVQKCLIQVSATTDHLEMHNLVRDMGREIVRMESPREPGKRSRLFNPQEVCNVLQGNKGSEKVEVLMVDRRSLNGANLSTKVFKKMKNLRVLKVDELHISGDFGLLSKELRWLSWKKCSLKCMPSNFPAEKLVVLDMQESNIEEFGLNLQCCKNLKKLDLSFCKRLKRTPNFDGSQSLETLLLQNCSKLTEIHPSIGNLVRLIVLDLGECKRLTVLPSSICHLKSLKSLVVSWTSLQKLPVDVGHLQELNTLCASYTGITQLPVSIEKLTHLTTLEVGSLYSEDKTSLLSRPRIRQIKSLPTFLSSLVLRYCGFSEADLPRNIGSLSCLRNLDLSGNKFVYLPFDFSEMPFLMSLRLNDCENLESLPSLSNLGFLRDLEIANCEELVKITSLDNLFSIQKINMVNCSSLQNPFKESFFRARAIALSHPFDLGISIDLQSNEIPDWCSNRVTASSICFTMPTQNNEYTFLGMILWCVRYSGPWDGWGIIIDGEMTLPLHWEYGYEIRAGYAELSSIQYRNNLMPPFNDFKIKGGEKIEVFENGKRNKVKKIGIHLLYLDQHGVVTSLPAIADHSSSPMMNESEENKKSLRRKESKKRFKLVRRKRKKSHRE